MARRSRNLAALLLVLVLVVLAAAAWAMREPRDKPVLGLFSTLPIYWGEAEDLNALLVLDGHTHWVRTLLERDYTLRPLDVIGGASQPVPLDKISYLVLAQPRALAPAENVALDRWVRGGGRLLLFADPMLTEHSHFALGDPRRPHGVVLLSPILRRWGLDLQFDDAQPAGVHAVPLFGLSLPVDLPGRFRLLPQGEGTGACTLHGAGLAAECTIGKGRVLILADAAVLDGENAGRAAREAALTALTARIFRDN
ncbi:hypothetical protein NT2_05_03910 [Caenibius tardaugens NBRC 16725]|uniref:ABC-type uncharacterized transport system domain-containing protein n=1 Tax=Caenibius tardaugens NBRC 16725 TaxID=1219035 RepID=U2YLE8_9SPHN|nr:hypothetical protein [Caenibius tardaugens]AZI36790.1 ABC transporter [Caenibius tardaugens NBRC 16725]GAD49470.1 hypothetical protein NT2_05_03910 [Caenibius tardaugens NBRC 16725]